MVSTLAVTGTFVSGNRDEPPKLLVVSEAGEAGTSVVRQPMNARLGLAAILESG